MKKAIIPAALLLSLCVSAHAIVATTGSFHKGMFCSQGTGLCFGPGGPFDPYPGPTFPYPPYPPYLLLTSFNLSNNELTLSMAPGTTGYDELNSTLDFVEDQLVNPELSAMLGVDGQLYIKQQNKNGMATVDPQNGNLSVTLNCYVIPAAPQPPGSSGGAIAMNGRHALGNTGQGVATLKLSQNPITDQLTFDMNLSEPQSMIVEVYNMEGKLVYSNTKQAAAGGCLWTHDPKLSTGMYVYRVTCGKQVFNGRFVKQ